MIVSAYFGYISNSWYGLTTGVVAPIALGSSFLIFLGQGDDMSINRNLRIKQSMGGFLNLIICTFCLYIGGWKYGWAWIIPGYIVGASVMFLFTKSTINQIQESSNKMIDSFESNASSNLGRDPDEDSIKFLRENTDLSALIWEMLGDAGASNGLRQNNKWSKECDYLLDNYVRNKKFKELYPGAHALIRYCIYLCDGKSGDEPRCSHPIDDFSAG